MNESEQAQTIADTDPETAYMTEYGEHPFPAFSANEVGRIIKAAMAAANPNSKNYSGAIECEWIAKANELEKMK